MQNLTTVFTFKKEQDFFFLLIISRFLAQSKNSHSVFECLQTIISHA